MNLRPLLKTPRSAFAPLFGREAVRLLKAATYAAAVDPETGLIASDRSLVIVSFDFLYCLLILSLAVVQLTGF